MEINVDNLGLINELNNFNIKKVNVTQGNSNEIIEMVLKEKVNLGIICVNEDDLAYYKKFLGLNNLNFEIKSTLKEKIIFLFQKNRAKNPPRIQVCTGR